ncbi:MAG TPA: hypothetical protein VM260_28085 [Pirellula sp.]|nr:hypothetical protein [Pirellula sp.]
MTKKIRDVYLHAKLGIVADPFLVTSLDENDEEFMESPSSIATIAQPNWKVDVTPNEGGAIGIATALGVRSVGRVRSVLCIT